WKLKCGTIFSSTSATSFFRSVWMSRFLRRISTTSSVTFFTSTSGAGASCAPAVADATSAAAAPAKINHRRNIGARFFLAQPRRRVFRRVAVVDQRAAALQVRIALEHVLVERGFLEDPACV